MRGGIDRAAVVDRPRTPRIHDILVTLCRFDDKTASGSNSGPFIPCERRLRILEIWEIQGHAFETAF